MFYLSIAWQNAQTFQEKTFETYQEAKAEFMAIYKKMENQRHELERCDCLELYHNDELLNYFYPNNYY